MNRSLSGCLAAATLLLSCSQRSLADKPLAGIAYDRDIRPILSDNCFHCHGPDAVQREAKLRLDTRQGMLADLGGYSAVVPGRPDSSRLLVKITHREPAERMPPPDSGRALSAEQVQLLRRWISAGAHTETHWAFLAPRRPPLPDVRPSVWPRNAIDHFILVRLKQSEMSPAAPADKLTLIRRLSFDLTGLPPTLAEIDAYVADSTPDAYETVVDRLLRSPHYGERMAMLWLDAARYADSHGYSLDRRRVMWPWRDWVIQAYNQNMSFDQFVIEQLAGDLLPSPTVAQQVATGFNRNHPIQSEGGVINEEYRVETVVDRVETTSAVFLGLTMGCGRCHDHKYDPITQREFYSVFALFNNVPESAHVGNSDNQADRPFITAPSVLHSVQQQDYQRRIAKLEQALREQRQTQPAARPAERVWIDDEIPAGAQSLGNGGGDQKFTFVAGPKHPVYSGRLASMRTSVGRGQHLVQHARPPLRLGPEARLFTYVYLDPDNPPKQIMLQWHDGRNWEHRAYWGGNHIPWGADKTTSRKRYGPLPPVGRWVRLEIDADDVGLSAGAEISGWAYTQFDGTVYWDKSGVLDVLPSPLAARLQNLKNELAEWNSLRPTSMVMSEMDPPRKTFVLTRGQYDQPSQIEVTPGIPAVLGRLAGTGRGNRLSLARWMAEPTNPLTARVAVNRYWQTYFGRGLVETPENFGVQGRRPSHPQLLDWLATEFVRTGWNVQAMQKLIVMSSTYRQSSRISAAQRELDPHNQLLGRGPRFRLAAEMIRDQALAVSGLLVDRVGGASVRPYQPPGLWDDVVYENVPRFQQDHGTRLYRRSMYTYWKRSVPPPNLQAFDAPSREACVLTRSRTNTPLSALVLMNDPTFVEAARKLAERVLVRKQQSSASRLVSMFRLVTGRPPSPSELRPISTALAAFRADFTQQPAAALKLLHVGESAYDEALNPMELAAYTAIANALLGLDEAITKQ